MQTNFGGRSLSSCGEFAPFLFERFSCLESAQKFMQIGVDVKCIRTNFGGCGLSGFGDTATLKNGQFSPSDHGL